MTTTFIAHPMGHVFETAHVRIFFGNSKSGPDHKQLATVYPELQPRLIHQTHSDIVIEASGGSNLATNKLNCELPALADAHFTQTKRQALFIRTADCLPVMIFEPISGFSAAIHAGWRGIENEIIIKTCLSLRAKGISLDQAQAWIGPHIGFGCFEVGTDVADSLFATYLRAQTIAKQDAASAEIIMASGTNVKAKINLLKIAQAQLISMGLKLENILSLPIDTYNSNLHESHRRDGDRAGRQMSFICVK
jgi:YfiH family protein